MNQPPQQLNDEFPRLFDSAWLASGAAANPELIERYEHLTRDKMVARLASECVARMQDIVTAGAFRHFVQLAAWADLSGEPAKEWLKACLAGLDHELATERAATQAEQQRRQNYLFTTSGDRRDGADILGSLRQRFLALHARIAAAPRERDMSSDRLKQAGYTEAEITTIGLRPSTAEVAEWQAEVARIEALIARCEPVIADPLVKPHVLKETANELRGLLPKVGGELIVKPKPVKEPEHAHAA